MQLSDLITSKVKIEPECVAEIDAAFATETHPKNTLLTRPESYSQKIYFIEKGLLRMFYYNKEKDITQFFFEEGTFFGPVESIFYAKPVIYGSETLEETTVRTILYKDVNALAEKHPRFQQFMFIIAIDILHQFVTKLESLQFQTAEERYQTLLQTHPDILRRASLGHIASYLGITQQTLSVIRGKK